MKNTIKNAVLSLVLSGLAACGGSKQANPPEETEQQGEEMQTQTGDMSVLSATPLIFSQQVARDAEVEVQFSENLNASSLTGSRFQLLRDGDPIAGTISIPQADRAVFTPDRELDLLTTYQPIVSSEIEDASGLPMAQGYEWAFVTRDGVWGEQDDLAYGSVDQPAITGAGDAFWAMYIRDNLFSGQKDLFAHPLGTEEMVVAVKLVSNGDNDGQVTGSISAKVFSDGDVLAVWEEEAEDGRDEIWYNRYDHTNRTWGKSARVAADNFDRYSPRLVSSNRADRVFVEYQLNDSLSGKTDIMMVEYVRSTEDWRNEAVLANDLDKAAGDGEVSVVMDQSGNMMALWFENGTVRTRYFDTTGPGWGDIKIISSSDAGKPHRGSAIVVDTQGDYIASWSQYDGVLAEPYIWTSRFTAGDGWSEAQTVSGSAQGARPVMRVNKDDNIMMLWTAGENFNLMFSGYNHQQNAWTSAGFLEDSDKRVYHRQLVVDASGNFMALWKQDMSGTFFDLQGNILLDPAAIWTRRFDHAISDDWQPAATLNSLGADVSRPVLAVNNKGEIQALWKQKAGTESSIQSRLFN